MQLGQVVDRDVGQHENRICLDRVVDAVEIRESAFFQVARDGRVVDVSHTVQIEEPDIPVDAVRVVFQDRDFRSG